MHSMRRLPLRIFNCQKFPLMLNFNFRRQFGLFQYFNKLQGNGKTTNLQPFLQKQLASSYTEIEKLPYKDGKYTNFLNIECIDDGNNKKYIRLSRQVCALFYIIHKKYSNFYAKFLKANYSNISLPEDAHSLIKAMDTMMNKFPDEEKPSIFHEFFKSSQPNCEYKLEIHPNKEGQLQIYLELFKNMENASSNRLGLIFFPVSLLPEFRDRMVKMLTKFDGTKQCGPLPSLLPKWITVEQEKAADEQPQYRIYRCESLKYSIDPDKPADRRISIAFRRGTSGKKFIRIEQRYDKPRLKAKRAEEEYIYIHFPNILVPDDGYNLLSGMIDLANDLKQKGELPIQRKNQQSSLICRQIVKGYRYDYKLEIHSYNDQQQLGFRMQTITTDAKPSHKPTKLFVPIHVFDWLQAQMAYSLAADLDTEEYEDKENIPAEDKSPFPNN